MYKKTLSTHENGDYLKQQARRDTSGFSSNHNQQRTNGNGNASSARSLSMQREKTSSRLMMANTEIKSNTKQRRVIARERWNMLKHVKDSFALL